MWLVLPKRVSRRPKLSSGHFFSVDGQTARRRAREIATLFFPSASSVLVGISSSFLLTGRLSCLTRKCLLALVVVHKLSQSFFSSPLSRRHGCPRARTDAVHGCDSADLKACAGKSTPFTVDRSAKIVSSCTSKKKRRKRKRFRLMTPIIAIPNVPRCSDTLHNLPVDRHRRPPAYLLPENHPRSGMVHWYATVPLVCSASQLQIY